MTTATRSQTIQNAAARAVAGTSYAWSGGPSWPREPASREIKVYFTLDPNYIENNRAADPFGSADLDEGPITYQAGQTYRVRVSTSTRRDRGQEDFTILSDIQLVLHIKGETPPGVHLDNPVHHVPWDRLQEFLHDFEIRVDNECPRTEFTLQMGYFDGSPNEKAVLVSSCRIRLEGTYNPVDQELAQRSNVALDTHLQEHVAMLYVEEPENNKFRLTGWSYRGAPFQTGHLDQPNIGLAQFVEHQTPPKRVRDEVSGFSRRSPREFINWVKDLANSGHHCLIIADSSASELPWEMLDLDNGQYLGAEILVVRWIPVRNFGSTVQLQFSSGHYQGSLLAYLDSADLTHTGQERDALDRLTGTVYASLPDLEDRLSQDLDSVGLVYLGCHGIFSYDDHDYQIAIGSLSNPTNRIAQVSLEGLPSKSGGHPVAFINACHSARLMRRSGGLYGFPEVCLAKIASSYIGTLAPVASQFAASVGAALLDAARASQDGVQIADFLRDLRRKAVAGLQGDAPEDEKWLNFVYSFMYVYYGNPFARLALSPR